MSWFKREPKSVTIVVQTRDAAQVFDGDIYFCKDDFGDLHICRRKPNGVAFSETVFRRRYWLHVKQISENA